MFPNSIASYKSCIRQDIHDGLINGTNSEKTVSRFKLLCKNQFALTVDMHFLDKTGTHACLYLWQLQCVF